MELEREFEKKHVYNVSKAKILVDRNFKWTNAKIADLFAKYDLRNPESFKFSSDKVLNERLMKILTTFSTSVDQSILQSAIISWGLANQKNDKLANQYLRSVFGATGIKKEYLSLNIPAMNEFIKRTEDGMNLSEKVWRVTQQYKDLLEAYVGSGVTAGRSSADISRDIRQLLVNPDKLFRRIRNKTNVLVLSKRAREYHPGAGIYRSAYKNAMRLAVTETNMAYRMSDYTRRQQLDFVMGIRIHISKSHPAPDICDYMAGDYPKDYVYRGWHPWCLCFTTSILMSGSEYKRMLQSGNEPKRVVKEIPENAKLYLNKHEKSFKNLKNKPYFISDNDNVTEIQNIP